MLSAFLDDITDRRGPLSPRRMSEAMKMPLSHLARIAKVHRNSLSQYPGSQAVQTKLGEVARVITTASDLLGGDMGKTIVWFRYQPLSGFDGKTAEDLVTDEHADAVLTHLELLRDGGYA